MQLEEHCKTSRVSGHSFLYSDLHEDEETFRPNKSDRKLYTAVARYDIFQLFCLFSSCKEFYWHLFLFLLINFYPALKSYLFI